MRVRNGTSTWLQARRTLIVVEQARGWRVMKLALCCADVRARVLSREHPAPCVNSSAAGNRASRDVGASRGASS